MFTGLSKAGLSGRQVNRVNVTSDDARQTTIDRETGDAGIGMSSVVVMLAVLAVIVVGIFWGLPAWFGDQVIEITVRN